MPGRAEVLFAQLLDAKEVISLVGEAEDAWLDVKIWPDRDDDAQRILAKAVCGFTNADGGVLVIGMDAKATSKEEADIINGAKPVEDTNLVRSRVLDWVSKFIEPSVVGIDVREVHDGVTDASGFVIVYIPKSEGSPRRSRKDSRFYTRMGSSTLPMEYWQIEDSFGKRPNPRLTLHLEPTPDFSGHLQTNGVPSRWLTLGIRNEGRGIAKFPGLRFSQNLGIHPYQFGIDGNGSVGLKLRPSGPNWYFFRGGADDVIYPGELILITRMYRLGVEDGLHSPAFGGPNKRWKFQAIEFQCDLFAEGMSPSKQIKTFSEDLEHS